MNIYTEQTIQHTEIYMAHLRVGDDIGTLQIILLNKQQLVIGAKYYIFQYSYFRYPYYEHNEVKFLWDRLFTINMQLDMCGDILLVSSRIYL